MASNPLDKRILELLKNGTREQRLYICDREPLYFAIYYFTDFFDYKIPQFHFDFYNDFKRLINGELEAAAWIAFRESAKTSIAKILTTHAICYKKKNFISYDSYDKDNSEAALFDISRSLQTNPKILSDFGNLYHSVKKKNEQKTSEMKRLSTFVTSNGVRVVAYSTQESTRGRIFDKTRPDFYVVDDVENSKTVVSFAVTLKIKAHLDEMRAGLGPTGSILYLGNYISENGVIAHVMERLKDNPRAVVRNIPVEKNGVIAWPDKYVRTQDEAIALNKEISERTKHKISLEAKKESLGEETFEREMMNNPAASTDIVFDREKIDQLILKARAPKRVVAGFKLWDEYNPSHRYAIGADTAKGIGRDSNADALIDFSTVPNRVVGTYKNNKIAPDIFAYELKNQGEMFGECLVAPEGNNTGYATITQLKSIYKNIFVAKQDEKVKEQLSVEYGFDTNSATKPEVIYQFKRAVEDGLLEILDIDLLQECKYYSQQDLQTNTLVDGMTRHFDLLMAAAIAWHMRSYAKLPIPRKPFKQSPHTPINEYSG